MGQGRARPTGGTVRRDDTVRALGTVRCRMGDGRSVAIPVVPGLLKHPSVPDLKALLRQPAVARKYTAEALRRAPWRVLERFPRRWLLELLPGARVRPARRRALEFLLG